MNVSQSIFTAPKTSKINPQGDGDGRPPLLTTSDEHAIDSDDAIPYTRSPILLHDESALDPARITSSSLENADLDEITQWSHRAELRQVDAAGSKKRTSSKVSPHLSNAGGPPPTKRLHRSRSELHSSAPHRRPDDRSDPAPLFFSNRVQERPALPYRLSSSEAGARMLSKASKEEKAGSKITQLARRSMNPGSPSRPSGPRTPSGSGRSYLGLSGKSEFKSPDAGVQSHEPLAQIGVVELLEQDERPTFILDLVDQANFEPGPIKLVYASASLRAASGVLDRITGIAGQESPGLTAATAFSDFKAWSVSYVRDHESLDVSLPSFGFAGATWTCSCLRKRFRVFRGFPSSPQVIYGSNPPSVGIPSSSSKGKENENATGANTEKVEAIEEDPQDYFGHVVPRMPAKPSRINNGDKSHQRTGSALKMGMLASPNSVHSQATSASGSISGSSFGSRDNEAILRAASAGDVDHFSMAPQTNQGFFDWTRLPNSPALPSHIRFARSIDWASTSLGPIESWSSELRSMCNLIMASPHPAAMYWGEEYVAIYNEAYILLAGSRHPQLMGQSYPVAWAEIWDGVKSVFESATTTGQATVKDDDLLFMQRSGSNNFLEETYFSWSIIPLVGADGSVVGLYNPVFEKTRRKVAERRMLTLRELGEKTSTARDLKTFWTEVLNGLRYNEMDAPFVLLYSVSDDIDSDSQSSMQTSNLAGPKLCVLEGSLGVPDGHAAAAPIIDLRNGSEYFAYIFRKAIKTDQPVYLSVKENTLDPDLLKGIEWRGFGDPCTAAVCCPIHLTGGEQTLGFLLMGVNPRRPYDDDYSLYAQLLTRQLATAMASVVLFEEEIARGRRAAKLADLDRIALSEQSAVRTKQAAESETRFTRMAELAPVGIFIADSKGKITYCNEKWYEISKVPHGSDTTDTWMAAIMDEDKERIEELWRDLVHKGVPLDTEMRYKTTWLDQNGNKGETWVLASAYPEKDEAGHVKVIFGSITDISQQKWAEHFEKRRMEEAVELKRQQENFIDITSHEMRNPLSAILQCSDEITTSLTDLKANRFPEGATEELTQNAIEASGTIALCAQHQKRIVDDILTLSKLDSALLLVTPCDVVPRTVVQRALKMFDGELQSHDIAMHFRIDESVDKLGIEWVKMDPSRVLQVLINLTTNAIKFTSTQQKRIINVTLGASLDRPSANGVVSYFPTRSKRKDLTQTPDWGTGEKVYIHFAVEDTGRGLTDDEKQMLFLRFSQASPRTHVQYGGSGLGLFISRELVELQGGEIGVASVAGEGSKFAFYVKGRRSTAPQDEMDQFPGAGARKSSATKHSSLPLSLKAPLASTDGPSSSRSTRHQRSDPNGGSLKILIVEDNLVNQKVLGRQLHNIGYVVHVANHGGECLERLQESTFWKGNSEGLEINVILMDQEMPVMDGLTCTREIRKLEANGDVTRHVPIIAVTANARSEQIDTAMAAGMDDVVSKPFRIGDLTPKVEELADKFPNPT